MKPVLLILFCMLAGGCSRNVMPETPVVSQMTLDVDAAGWVRIHYQKTRIVLNDTTVHDAQSDNPNY